jgi:hypothetical protein
MGWAIHPESNLWTMGKKFVNPDTGTGKALVLLHLARGAKMEIEDVADIVGTVALVVRCCEFIGANLADYLVNALIQLGGSDHFCFPRLRNTELAALSLSDSRNSSPGAF